MIETNRLLLRPMEKEDTDRIVVLRSNPRIRDNFFSYEFITKDKHLQWYNNNLNSKNRIDLVITLKENKKIIGVINFSSIDLKNQKAEYGIFIAEEEWGKGYASESSKGFIKYGFREINLNKIYLKVFSDNQSAIKLYGKLGFKEEGTLREEIYKKGKFNNVKIMSLLKRDSEIYD